MPAAPWSSISAGAPPRSPSFPWAAWCTKGRCVSAAINSMKRSSITFDAITACLSANPRPNRSEEHTSELQSLMRISYAVFCLNKKMKQKQYELHNNLHTNELTIDVHNK